jgi:beta-N-acetylglucosaminidase
VAVVKSSVNQIIDIGTAEKKVEVSTSTSSTASPEGLSFDMKLNKPSGFTLEQFKQALSDSKDKNKIFEKNAEYFYYIESQYNINGMFVAAVGIHESAWGTSKLALNKHNLFGYGAYDSNPYNGAYSFDDYSESIDLLARVFVKYYLNPAGTKIYGDEVASGKYYSGGTLTAVNSKYASDSNWANSVYSYMKYLYNKI